MSREPWKHGTIGGYSNHKCRCDACAKVWRDYCRELAWDTGRRRPMEIHLNNLIAKHVHGTEGGYNRGCKCALCLTAASEARKERRENGEVRTHNANGYSNGCRCDICREAHTVYRRRRRAAA